MDSRAGSLLAITGITLLSGAVAYALYFDHKRRNDAEFRKMLRKDKKRADKSIAESKEAQQQEALASAAASGQPVNIEEVLEKIRTEEPPPTPELKEKYFMDCIARGEQLGPEFYLAAAAEFYRALKVYPSPMELIVIYEKTVPAPVFELIVQMMNVDVSHVTSTIVNGQSALDDDGETSSTSGGPPSEASSQEWDKVTDPGTNTPAT
ncbi:hypothetical protein H0H93_010817 [Arthromyces matolae]|nr:hypothetical protein H0H93_010817 [Arthromyces matolae]